MNAASKAQPGSVDYDEALRIIPVLVANGELLKAKRWGKVVVSARPTDPRAWNQNALVSMKMGNFPGAKLQLAVAVLLEPGAPELMVNRGNALRIMASHNEAVTAFQRALLARPDDGDIAVALALQLLTLGDYQTGFAMYERRWARRTAFQELERFGIPVLEEDGLATADRVVCVIEQGAGDSIQFIRYAAELQRMGVEVTVYCTEALARLLAHAAGVSRVVTRLRTGEYGHAEMLMSLPYRFDATLETVLYPGRYIEPPVHPYRLPDRPARPKVGLCWAGNPHHRRDGQRSCPYDVVSILLEVEGIDFYSLQVGDGAGACHGDDRIVDLSDKIDDFADTAGLVDQLDLVVTIDSAVAHIAGALDRECWVLLHWVADWRWGQSGESSPWYPRTRLERRKIWEAWESMMPRVRAALVQWRDDWVAAAPG